MGLIVMEPDGPAEMTINLTNYSNLVTTDDLVFIQRDIFDIIKKPTD